MESGALPPRSVGFMDELSVFIDLDRLSNQSSLALQLFGSPAETPLLDVVLSALSDGTFLAPLLFFRGTAAELPDGFPENVLLEARQDGFTEQERLHIWTHKVCLRLSLNVSVQFILPVMSHDLSVCRCGAPTWPLCPTVGLC